MKFYLILTYVHIIFGHSIDDEVVDPDNDVHDDVVDPDFGRD